MVSVGAYHRAAIEKTCRSKRVNSFLICTLTQVGPAGAT